VIASKLGLVPAPDDPDRVVDGRPSNVVRAIEGSLSRLGTDVIDLYQLHRVDPQVPVEETVGAMAELVAAGKVRYLGVSEVTADQLRRAHATYPVVSVQSEYSLFERTVEREVLGECDRLGVGLLAFGPLGKGLLSGSLQGVRDFASSDLRHRLPRFRGENLTRNQTVVEQLADIADSVRLKPGQLALAWLLARAPWVVPIPGTRNLKHLAENVAAAEANVGADVLAKVDEAIGPQTVAGQRYPEGWRLPRN
jgi:aryl-alcohol dehydrogenase-like predicted oxidoreductase